jgi:PAS domain S-box-containing protein
MLEAIPDMMFLLSRDGVYLDLHVQDPSVLLVPPEQFLGKHVRDLMPSDLVERFVKCFEEVTRSGHAGLVEYSVPILGEERHFEARVVNCDGSRVLSLVRDITDRKQVEQMQREFGKQLLQAQEAERARLARELHDDITQRLGVLAINADRLDSEADLIEQRKTIRGIRDSLKVLSEDVHSLAYKLHPALLEQLGLAAALQAECERLSRQESIPVDVKLDGLPTNIAQEARLCLFRVTQEALSNVARHAHAQAVQVSLHSMDGGLQLSVADNGAGFDPAEEPQQPSLGLASMRERVRLLEGKLHVESKRGRGTTILAWIPVKTHDLPDTANRENGESAFTNGVQVGAISVRGES